jgi:predicted aspartyl protease
VPIAVTNGSKATVDVTLGSTIVNFTIDTGAEVMSLPKIIANGLVADGSASDVGTTSIKVADGRIIEERRIIIDRLQIGSHVLRNVVAIVPDNDDAMLLLPFTVLNQMGKFTIDTTNGRLIFG